MSLIQRTVFIEGAIGSQRTAALFDSGASYSCMSRSLAGSVAHLELLPVPMEFETADSGCVLCARYRVTIDFRFEDSPRRFSDEVIVVDGLSEELIIGASTMQKWRIALDFDREEVVYDRTMHRLWI